MRCHLLDFPVDHLNSFILGVKWDFRLICRQKSFDACNSRNSINREGMDHHTATDFHEEIHIVANLTFTREATMMVDSEVFNHENSIELAVEVLLDSAHSHGLETVQVLLGMSVMRRN